MHTLVKLRAGQQKYGNKSLNTHKYNEVMYQMEMQTWQPYRLFGLFSSFCALTFTTVAICNKYWFIGKGYHAGIWEQCFFNATRTKTPDLCTESKPYWQNGVIGLLIFAASFGFLATILSICGVCMTHLPRKVYYYHSAGEIFLISALSCITALVIYPVAVEVEDEDGLHSFGVGYGVGWGASFFYLASSICMCLDELITSLARCKCFRKDNDGDTSV